MISIELDDRTATELQDAAKALGMSVEAFVRLRVLGKPSVGAKSEPNDFDFEAEFDALAISAPPLPTDFSREHIYPDDY